MLHIIIFCVQQISLKFKSWSWLNRIILYCNNIKLCTTDLCNNSLSVYCTFFVCHIPKAYLGSFQTSMMPFFWKKNYHERLIGPQYTLRWYGNRKASCGNDECLLKEHLLIKVKGLSILHSSTGYLRLTLVFVWNGALQEKFIFYFSRVFCYKIFILAGGLDTRLSFYGVWTLSWYFLIPIS